MGKLKYQGNISKTVDIEYFPFEIKNKEKMTLESLEERFPDVEDWKIIRELNLLNTNPEILYRPFNTLSGGEQVKVLLSSLFAKENEFLLIDEPTNHLDLEAKKAIEAYLQKKKGYILVSHDRKLLDNTCDHILAINNSGIEIIKGNYSTWKENKDRRDVFELKENEKLKSEISKLDIASKRTANWSDKVEKSKYGDSHVDKGYIGHKAEKMMKRSKAILLRQEKKIKEKEGLLKNIDRIDSLVIKPLEYMKNNLVLVDNLGIKYGNKTICENVSFEINRKDRIALTGKNGSGKSSILKLLLGDNIEYFGDLKIGNNIKISYVPQTTEILNGLTMRDYTKKLDIDESIFKAMLSKLGVDSKEFNKKIDELSEGQKKKVLISASISNNADLYIWDEPLNYIDIESRLQIEEAILKYEPTIIFVEHDETFVQNIATKIIKIGK